MSVFTVTNIFCAAARIPNLTMLSTAQLQANLTTLPVQELEEEMGRLNQELFDLQKEIRDRLEVLIKPKIIEWEKKEGGKRTESQIVMWAREARRSDSQVLEMEKKMAPKVDALKARRDLIYDELERRSELLSKEEVTD